MKAKVYFTKEITPGIRSKDVSRPGDYPAGKGGCKGSLRRKGQSELSSSGILEAHGGGSAGHGGRDQHRLRGCLRRREGSYRGALEIIQEHGWTKYFQVDILDAEEPDLVWPVPGGKVLKENHVGSHTVHYDSMLVLAHFKGHPMGGYGGALKQLAIGCASSRGKALIHSAGKTDDRYETWKQHASEVAFPEAMADAASSITAYFKDKIAFINVMKNLSVDCDCCEVAEDPCMKDIGILASLDPVAIDQACMDLVLRSDDPGKEHFMERVNSRNGIHTIEAAADLGMGSRSTKLIEI